MASRQDPLTTPLPPIREAAVAHLEAQHDLSVAPTPSSSTSSTAVSAGKKRRTSATGSRCVSKLNPEQLAKKRANDREAQKAIRERTKAQIETLERKIRDLTDQKPYQELQDVIRQKEAVEAENEDIKRRLTTVLSIVQPICQTGSVSCECGHTDWRALTDHLHSYKLNVSSRQPAGSSVQWRTTTSTQSSARHASCSHI